MSSYRIDSLAERRRQRIHDRHSARRSTQGRNIRRNVDQWRKALPLKTKKAVQAAVQQHQQSKTN